VTPSGPPFSCDSRPERGTIVVCPVGEVDLATANMVEEALATARASRPERLLLDLSGVTFLDSTGLRAVLAADADARSAGIPLEIVPGGPSVQRVFEVAGLTDHLHFAGAL
jgi:anti-sigma B factor antagonist